MNFADLLAAKKEAATKLHVSASIRETFIALFEAYLTGFPTDDKLYIHSYDIDDHVRSRITMLRAALKGIIFRLPDGRSLEFNIPHGRPYRLEEAKSSSMNLLWTAHTHHKEGVIIQAFEELFFRSRDTCIRDFKVNRAEDVERIADRLKPLSDEFSPTYYVSSGAMRAATTLQNFFIGNGKTAQLNSSPDLSEEDLYKKNLILLGSARVKGSLLNAMQFEKFKAVDNGISNGFFDKLRNDAGSAVFVLMSRRNSVQGSGVHTLFESSHERAIHGVCQQLVDRDSNLCADVVAQLRKVAQSLPETFQVVFKVSLPRSTHYISLANKVEVVACQPYQQDRQQREEEEAGKDQD